MDCWEQKERVGPFVQGRNNPAVAADMGFAADTMTDIVAVEVDVAGVVVEVAVEVAVVEALLVGVQVPVISSILPAEIKSHHSKKNIKCKISRRMPVVERVVIPAASVSPRQGDTQVPVDWQKSCPDHCRTRDPTSLGLAS